MNFKLFAVLMLLLSAFVAGCGIKGPLYMPPADDSVAAVDEEPSAEAVTAADSSSLASDAQQSNATATDDEIMTDADKVNSVLNSDNVGNKASATTR